jgi:hypothetical protein
MAAGEKKQTTSPRKPAPLKKSTVPRSAALEPRWESIHLESMCNPNAAGYLMMAAK